MITFALPKGRIFDEIAPLLKAAGIDVAEDPEKTRKLIIGTSRPDVRLVIVRASDVPTYVQYGGSAQNTDISLNSDLGMPYPNEVVIKKERLEKSKLEKKEISERTTQQFYEDFGNLPIVNSESTSEFDKITFIKDGTAQTAYYDVSFSLVGTIADKTFEDLPNDAQNYINRHYNEYTVRAVRYFDDNEANNTNINIYDQISEDGNSYFVELESDNKMVILRVTSNGDVYFFKELK